MKKSLAVSVTCTAIFWLTQGYKRRTLKLCVLTRWDFISASASPHCADAVPTIVTYENKLCWQKYRHICSTTKTTFRNQCVNVCIRKRWKTKVRQFAVCHTFLHIEVFMLLHVTTEAVATRSPLSIVQSSVVGIYLKSWYYPLCWITSFEDSVSHNNLHHSTRNCFCSNQSAEFGGMQTAC